VFPKELAWKIMRFMLWTKEFRVLTQIRRKVITVNYFEELQLTSGYVTKGAVPHLAKR